jgi:hypothetical protein
MGRCKDRLANAFVSDVFCGLMLDLKLRAIFRKQASLPRN